MKVTKLPKEDLIRLDKFMEMLYEVLNDGTYTEGEESEPELVSPERFMELAKEHWFGSDWFRSNQLMGLYNILSIGYRTLIDNACDPDVNYIEWRPDVKAFLESTSTKNNDRI